MNNKSLLLLLAAAPLVLTACASNQPRSDESADVQKPQVVEKLAVEKAAPQHQVDLYNDVYQKYAGAIANGDFATASSMLSQSALHQLGRTELGANDLPVSIVSTLIRENSEYQTFYHDGNLKTGCLTINGFTLNGEYGTTSYGYVFEGGAWKIDHIYYFPRLIYPNYAEYNGKTFPDKAICPKQRGTRQYTEWK
jgi:hypothetical protein